MDPCSGSLKRWVLCALALGAMAPSASRSAALTVNSTAETVSAVDGFCTLREAITAADTDMTSGGAGGECAAGSGDETDTIVFGVSGTIVLGSTLPIVTSTTGLIIDGTGQSVTVSGNNAVRVLQADGGAMLELRDLTVAYGNGGAGDVGGGGVRNSGTLSVTNSTFSNNNDGSEAGGAGIFNDGTLNVTNSTFSNNIVTNFGGGIFNSGGTLKVTNSTFFNNGGGNGGGGIANNGGTLNVTNSTFSNNIVLNAGGGINNTGTLSVTNSTFFDNRTGSGGNGGGLYTAGETATVTNCTFSGNQSPVLNGTNIAQNGGTLTLRNTIVANGVGPGTSCSGTIVDGGGNLRWPEADTSCTGAPGDPILSDLAENGGTTETMALGAGSAAIDAVNPDTCADAPVSNLDQRGFARPMDGDGDGSPICDIGAFEGADGPTHTPTVTPTSTVTSTATETATDTETSTATATDTATETATATATDPATETSTASATATATGSGAVPLPESSSVARLGLLLALLAGTAALLRPRGFRR